MKKKLFGILGLLLAISCLTSCQAIEDTFELTSREYEFIDASKEYEIKTDKVDLYFVENGKTPYVSVYDMINALDGFLQSYCIKVSKFQNGYIFSWRNILRKYKMICNATNNTIEVNDTSFFNFVNSPSATDYNAFIQTDNFWYSNGHSVTFDLGKYGFDIISKNQNCYIPLCIFNTIFCSSSYVNVYFNGDKLIVVDQFLNVGTTTEEYTEYKTSSLNNTFDNNRIDAYNSLAFAFDYYYGLKEDKEYTSFEECCPQEIKDKILNPDPAIYNRGYYDFLQIQLDDLHTSMYIKSFYNDPSEGHGVLNPENMGEFWTEFYAQEDVLYEKLQTIFPEGVPYLRYYDDTAIIYFEEFMTGSNEEIYDEEGNVKEDAWLYDSYFFFRKCMDEIEEHGNINNVVIDLTTNGGGNLGAMLRVMGFLSDEPVYYAMKDCLNGMHYIDYENVDTDGDGDYYDEDGYSKYKWNILTSLNTFSAANYFTAACKNLGIANIIGEKSGGGACSVLPIVLADGTSLRMSSNNILCTVRDAGDGNKYFDSVEHGVEVDKEISLENFYNDEYIDQVISENILVDE